MPKDERAFTLLVACPDDVQEEAQRVYEVVEELNIGLGQLHGVRLNVVGWKTHALPGIGSDPQEVINQQLPQEYDIFLGVMWARFGTATPRAGSGTEEEFMKAVAHYRKNPSDVRIMFYFKHAPVPMDNIDHVQLGQVVEFRERLHAEGILYWKFESSKEFEQELRRHLTRQLMELASPSDDGPPDLEAKDVTDDDEKGEAKAVAGAVGEDDEELGYIDYLDQADEQFDKLKAIVERMTTAITDVGSKMRERTKDIEEFVGGRKEVSRKDARVLFGRAATDMNCFASQLNEDLPGFRATLSAGVRAAREAAWLIPDGPAREAQLKKSLDALGGFRSNLDSAIDAIAGFRTTVQNLPKLTVELNRAKRGVSVALTEVLDAMTGGRHLVEKTIGGMEKRSVSDEEVDGEGQSSVEDHSARPPAAGR